MYYLYLFLSLLSLDGFFSDAGKITLNNAISTFIKTEQKLTTAIEQFEKSENLTKKRVDKLRLEFQRKETELNNLKISLVDNKVRSKKYLDKIKSFLED